MAGLVPAIHVFVARLSGRQRMMFVHYAPFAIDFAQTHRQSEFERLALAASIDVDAPSYCRSEGDIRTASDLYIVESKRNGLFNRCEERLPGCHVRIETPRQERWRYVEHQNISVVVRANGSPVFVANRLAPLLDQRADLRLVCCVLWFVRHVFPSLRKGSAFNLASRKPMHQTQGRANGGTWRSGRAFAARCQRCRRRTFPGEEENAASFVRFQFHEKRE